MARTRIPGPERTETAPVGPPIVESPVATMLARKEAKRAARGKGPMPASERTLRCICATAGFRSLTEMAEASKISRHTLALALKGRTTLGHPQRCALAYATGTAVTIIDNIFNSIPPAPVPAGDDGVDPSESVEPNS